MNTWNTDTFKEISNINNIRYAARITTRYIIYELSQECWEPHKLITNIRTLPYRSTDALVRNIMQNEQSTLFFKKSAMRSVAEFTGELVLTPNKDPFVMSYCQYGEQNIENDFCELIAQRIIPYYEYLLIHGGI